MKLKTSSWCTCNSWWDGPITFPLQSPIWRRLVHTRRHQHHQYRFLHLIVPYRDLGDDIIFIDQSLFLVENLTICLPGFPDCEPRIGFDDIVDANDPFVDPINYTNFLSEPSEFQGKKVAMRMEIMLTVMYKIQILHLWCNFGILRFFYLLLITFVVKDFVKLLVLMAEAWKCLRFMEE